MDIKQLHYFCTIVEEGQITRAAKKLHMAQPPLSQQLKQLEQELDVKLFDRNGRNMDLTESGKILYGRAKQLLSQVNDTMTEVKETAEGIKGILSIGASKSCFAYLPERIRKFHEKYPLVTFRLREGDTFYIGELLKNREIELAITRLPLEIDDVSMISFPAEPYVFVIPEAWESHLKNRRSIKMVEIKDFPLLLLHRINGKGQFELIVNECRRHGFEPNVILDCPDVSMILSLVSAGVGATIVPKSTLQSHYSNKIVALELEDASITSESAIIWLKDRYLSKSASHLIETFKKA
ncbi:MAG TPA: LysR family transcriptional regulator [Chondromyces sp.]|nr:LysR family transcriptional regulator [Chondromyces sp.]